MRELRNLHRAHEKSMDARFSGRFGERTAADIKVAEDILAAIIERAPMLLDFDTANSEEAQS